jgi:hypothetical protein
MLSDFVNNSNQAAKRETRAIPWYQFVLSMVCGIFSTASSEISGARADVDRDIEGRVVKILERLELAWLRI